jgi:hypothetical protein
MSGDRHGAARPNQGRQSGTAVRPARPATAPSGRCRQGWRIERLGLADRVCSAGRRRGRGRRWGRGCRLAARPGPDPPSEVSRSAVKASLRDRKREAGQPRGGARRPAYQQPPARVVAWSPGGERRDDCSPPAPGASSIERNFSPDRCRGAPSKRVTAARSTPPTLGCVRASPRVLVLRPSDLYRLAAQFTLCRRAALPALRGIPEPRTTGARAAGAKPSPEPARRSGTPRWRRTPEGRTPHVAPTQADGWNRTSGGSIAE